MSSNRAGEPRDSAEAVDPGLYRQACGRFATGIAIVTVADSSGRPHGLTVNSFTSVSLDPPLVMVSIDLRNSALHHFRSAAWFGVNVLSELQEDLSNRFARVPEDRFAGVVWSPSAHGVPLLGGAIAQLECGLASTMDVGDHAVLIGEVRAAAYTDDEPLLYFRSAYRRLLTRLP
jgi:flavin reductase (DIM6/NTAB) family NADH-FMN oxidoreductase RutF